MWPSSIGWTFQADHSCPCYNYEYCIVLVAAKLLYVYRYALWSVLHIANVNVFYMHVRMYTGQIIKVEVYILPWWVWLLQVRATSGPDQWPPWCRYICRYYPGTALAHVFWLHLWAYITIKYKHTVCTVCMLILYIYFLHYPRAMWCLYVCMKCP